MSGAAGGETRDKARAMLRSATYQFGRARLAIGDAIDALPSAVVADLTYGDGGRLLRDVKRGLRDAQRALALMQLYKYPVDVLAQHLDAQANGE